MISGGMIYVLNFTKTGSGIQVIFKVITSIIWEPTVLVLLITGFYYVRSSDGMTYTYHEDWKRSSSSIKVVIEQIWGFNVNITDGMRFIKLFWWLHVVLLV
jgi:hypothetical protein